EIERGESGQPEIKGYSKEYLEASSPRRRQIEEHLSEHGLRGAGAAQIAAHQTREGKLEITHQEMQERHRAMAQAFGDQPERVIDLATRKGHIERKSPEEKAQSAITFSKERNLEREAVTDELALLRDALKRSIGEATFSDDRNEFV